MWGFRIIRMSYSVFVAHTHFSSSTRSGLIKIAIIAILALLCLLERTTGLENYTISTRASKIRRESGGGLSGEVITLEGYDPVEAYHQLRRHYLTSTSRGDRDGLSSWDSPSTSRHLKHHHHHHPKEDVEVHHYQRNSSPNSQKENHYYNHHTQEGQQHGQKEYLSNYYDNSNNNHQLVQPQQRCYVCLPPNKSSREARDILAMFSKEQQSKIADCAAFDQSNNSAEYDFPCPPTFGGCILRIHGPNISRACSRYRLNDCKKANSVEFCYCTDPLCNDVKPQPVRIWRDKGRSGHNNQHHREDDDEDGDLVASGHGEINNSNDIEIQQPPSDSGVVHQYTTTIVQDSAPLANFNLNAGGIINSDSSTSNSNSIYFYSSHNNNNNIISSLFRQLSFLILSFLYLFS